MTWAIVSMIQIAQCESFKTPLTIKNEKILKNGPKIWESGSTQGSVSDNIIDGALFTIVFKVSVSTGTIFSWENVEVEVIMLGATCAILVGATKALTICTDQRAKTMLKNDFMFE